MHNRWKRYNWWVLTFEDAIRVKISNFLPGAVVMTHESFWRKIIELGNIEKDGEKGFDSKD